MDCPQQEGKREGEWKGNRFVLVIHFEAAAAIAAVDELPSSFVRQLDNRRRSRNLSYIISSLRSYSH